MVKRGLKFIPLLVLLVIPLGIGYLLFVQPLVSGALLHHSLMKEIGSAKKIRIIEHSCEWDVRHPSGVSADESKFVEEIYATAVLDQAQTSQLKTALHMAADYSGMGETSCIFDPHHRLEITRADGTVLTIELCFVCGEMQIGEEGKRIFPNGWEKSLKQFIASLAMRPDGPWIIHE